MNRNAIRLMVLMVLILICIGQTIMLWLGDLSGHNFFADRGRSYEISYVLPKEVWCNINGNIYKIERSGEREDLMSELVEELRLGNKEVEKTVKEDYAKLIYETQGIVYEFGTPLTIDEIIGQNLEVRPNKYEGAKIEEIYVDLSNVSAYKVYVYLIDEEAKIQQKITLKSLLGDESELLALYKDEENVSRYQVYQSSLTSTSEADFFKGNTFYLQPNLTTKIEGEVFKLVSAVGDLRSQTLENYVNDLFKNPSYKTVNRTENGIAFSDNLNISVKYNTVGTLEFQKTLLNNVEKITHIDAMNKVNLFIENSGAIPEGLKKGLYLEEVYTDSETKEKHYCFGYRYEDGQMVVLSDEVKQALGIRAFVELIIANGEIVRGKWLMLTPSATEEKVSLTMNSRQALETIYENSGIQDLALFKLESLEGAYFIDNLEESANLEWIGICENQIIRGIEKIDSE